MWSSHTAVAHFTLSAAALLFGVLSSSVAGGLSQADITDLELSSFYADCGVYDDPLLFGGPVCGVDGNTYANCVHLACINHWRSPADKVKIACKGPCPELPEPQFPWSPVYMPVCATDNNTFANLEALILYNDRNGQELLVQHDGECVDSWTSCLGVDSSFWAGAVCATNGRTYPSVEAIADMRRFGQCLDVLHDGGCTVDEVKERLRSRSEVCDLARNFWEYNPACGEDNITYANPYIMICFRPTIEAQYMGECYSPLHRACQEAVDIDTGVSVSPGPVCSSDGLTYTSASHLDCAKNNDKYLYLLHEGPCQPEDSPCVRMPEVTDGGAPVCATDGVTYVNSHALWCIQRKEDPFLRFFHDGPCFRRCLECSCGY